MDNNLTVSALTFNSIYSDKSGSTRRETSRGASLPTELLISHQPFIDSKTKRPGIRTKVEVAYYMAMTDGKIEPFRVYLVSARPIDPLVTAGVVSSIEAMLVNLLHGTTNTNGLDLHAEILATNEQ